MILNHYKHPSIFIWGILNECARETIFGRSCYEKQFDLIRKMDDTRPCTLASCKFFQDICFDLPDVVSCNLYPRWYVDKPVKDYLDESGMDVTGMSDEEILEASEIFPLADGTYLIVEG